MVYDDSIFDLKGKEMDPSDFIFLMLWYQFLSWSELPGNNKSSNWATNGCIWFNVLYT